MTLFDRILAARGLRAESMAAFLDPDYSSLHDPFLMTDMEKAVERLVIARKNQERIVIYGDYDIDGLTASTLLRGALNRFGFSNIDIFIPNRFIEGYGLTNDAIEKIAKEGARLIVTVDCGSSSHKEIVHAKKLGVDVIVTDHHSIIKTVPSAFAVINPKRKGDKYPFDDLAGVGVVYKLVQALQTKFNEDPSTGRQTVSPSNSSGLAFGQEKWLLDLVALGTVCDVVPLVDENRTLVYWGLKVLSKTRRPGLKALMAVAGIDPKCITARSLGFGIGPRMNAAGRLETAQHALDLLIASDPMIALEKAEYLDSLNRERRFEQSKIMKQAIINAEEYVNDPVLVISASDWNHGIVGIVAARLMEQFKKPAVILQEMGDETKGSARSFGDFNIIDAINDCADVINHGGGHQFAAGITLPTENISAFRKRMNEYYQKQKLPNQQSLLLPKFDAVAELYEVTEELVDMISQLEPFGIGNPQPILKTEFLSVVNMKRMGTDAQHVKLELQDKSGLKMQFLAFSAPEQFFTPIGVQVSVWFQPNVNEWQGRRSVEGQLLHVEVED